MLRSETRCLINKYEWCWVCTCMCKQYKRDLHCHRMIKELHGLVVQPHQRLPELYSNTNKLNCARCVTNAHHTGREQWWQAAWRNSNVTNDILIRTAKTCRSIEHTACKFRSMIDIHNGTEFAWRIWSHVLCIFSPLSCFLSSNTCTLICQFLKHAVILLLPIGYRTTESPELESQIPRWMHIIWSNNIVSILALHNVYGEKQWRV